MLRAARLGATLDAEEEEANWLSGALLVPRDGLMRAYRRQKDEGCLADHFGISLAL